MTNDFEFDPEAPVDDQPKRRGKPGTDAILPRVEKALKKSQLSATAFGYLYFGDPTIVSKLRKGRRLKKLRSAMDRVCKEIGA